jgi:hypothetical protein
MSRGGRGVKPPKSAKNAVSGPSGAAPEPFLEHRGYMSDQEELNILTNKLRLYLSLCGNRIEHGCHVCPHIRNLMKNCPKFNRDGYTTLVCTNKNNTKGLSTIMSHPETMYVRNYRWTKTSNSFFWCVEWIRYV